MDSSKSGRVEEGGDMGHQEVKYPAIKKIREDLGPGLYDFYRCFKCARIITREEEVRELRRLNDIAEDAAGFCVCGSLKIYPLRKPVRLEWLYPNVLRYTIKLVLARGVAPWAEKYAPFLLPLIERLVRPKEA